MLNRLDDAGAVKRAGKDGRAILWMTDDKDADTSQIKHPYPVWNEGKGADDGRLRPRLGKIPVDVEIELLEMVKRFERPVTEAEIVAAWGKMRVRRGRASAAGDLANLIKAERRRAARAVKRLRRDAA